MSVQREDLRVMKSSNGNLTWSCTRSVEEVTMFGRAARWEDPYLDFPLYCVFSQAAGVADLPANEAQYLALMAKAHVGPTGGRVYTQQSQMDTSRP